MNSAGGVDTLEVNKTLQFSVLKNGQPYTDVNYSVDPNNLGNITVDGLFTATADGGVTIKAVDKIKAENVATKQLVITPVVVPPVAPIATTDLDFTWDGAETKVVGTLAFDKSDNVDLNEAKKLKLTLEKEAGGNQQYEVGVTSVVDLVVNIDGTVPDKVVKVVTLDSLNKDDGSTLDITLTEGQSDFINPPAQVVNKATLNLDAELVKVLNTNYNKWNYSVNSTLDASVLVDNEALDLAPAKLASIAFKDEATATARNLILPVTVNNKTIEINSLSSAFGDKINGLMAEGTVIKDNTNQTVVIPADKIELGVVDVRNPQLRQALVDVNTVYEPTTHQVTVTGTITFDDITDYDINEVTKIRVEYSDGTLLGTRARADIPVTVAGNTINVDGTAFITDVGATKAEGITALLKADNSEFYGYQLNNGNMGFVSNTVTAKAVLSGTATLVKQTKVAASAYSYDVKATLDTNPIANQVNIDNAARMGLSFVSDTGNASIRVPGTPSNNIFTMDRIVNSRTNFTAFSDNNILYDNTNSNLINADMIELGVTNVENPTLKNGVMNINYTYDTNLDELSVNGTITFDDIDGLDISQVNKAFIAYNSGKLVSVACTVNDKVITINDTLPSLGPINSIEGIDELCKDTTTIYGYRLVDGQNNLVVN